MFKSVQQIIKDMDQHIQQGGGSYEKWYVGVTNEPKGQLFEEHGIHQRGDSWIYKRAFTGSSARSVGAHFIKTLGTDGRTRGSGGRSIYVYAYKKNPHTIP